VTETVGVLDCDLPKPVATELARLRAENARLLRLLEATEPVTIAYYGDDYGLAAEITGPPSGGRAAALP
jgi:hypothetical protein